MIIFFCDLKVYAYLLKDLEDRFEEEQTSKSP